MSFLTSFFNITDSKTEVAVCCPFDHYTTEGIPYKENHPSAHINTVDNVFHCKVCNAGGSEATFISRLLGCSYVEAKKLQRAFNNNEDLFEYIKETELSEDSKTLAHNLGMSDEVIDELYLSTPPQSLETKIAYPAFMFGHLVDIRQYSPETNPKVLSRTGAPSGLVIPFDSWIETPKQKLTLICAGEKDMAIARTMGFNAITITGGEMAFPNCPNYFKDRQVAIVYDNDTAGKLGAIRLAVKLLSYTQYIKIVSKFHEVCIENKEDIWDYFMKYNKTKDDLVECIKATPYFVPTEEDLRMHYPVVDLLTASRPDKVGTMLQSNIQVVATSEASFTAPEAIIAEKFRLNGKAEETMYLNETRDWELNDNTCQHILHLVDNNFSDSDVLNNIKGILRIPQKEAYVSIKSLAKATIFKCYVTDMAETNDTNTQPTEYTAYSINQKLESGKKYLITYKLTPHPYKGQQLTMIITNAVQANDSVSNFKITEQAKENLNAFINLQGTVAERIDLITEKVKGLLGYNGNNQLIQIIDLAYHTVLQFNLGTFKNIRGYLDTIIVGESRVGKSSTAETLRRAYQLGTFTSLAGNSATVAGLIGGSNKTASGGYQTRAGIIPQNHRGLIIFEEFGKSNANITTELTDIRSSNEVRITRVAGSITLPALVRMIALTNVKANKGNILPIASYPNGIAIVKELVPTAEDIARYDIIAVLADKGASQIDPFWEAQEPFTPEQLQTRIRWVWSRNAEQVLIDRDVGLHIFAKANELNAVYECHIKIFGTEAWKKIARLSIAIAGYLVSTDEDYENIVVTKDHVNHAVELMKQLYDNPTFKLKEYVDNERKYSLIDDDGVAVIEDIYAKAPALILQLEQHSSVTKGMLQSSTGLETPELNKALNKLTKGLFIRFDGNDIIPTERFRLGVGRINRQINVVGAGMEC